MSTALSPWSNEELVARMKALGVSEANLVRERNFPALKDMTPKKNRVASSPTLRTLEKQAEILGWTLPELPGIRPQRILTIDHDKLGIAIHLALAAIETNQMRFPLRERASNLAALVDRAYGYVDLVAPHAPDVFDQTSSAFSDILAKPISDL